MREIRTILALLLPSVLAGAAEYSRPIRDALNAIRQERSEDGLARLEGHTPGYPGRYGAYILHFRKIYGNATRQDIENMLKDPSPAIRLAGAAVALNLEAYIPALNNLSQDSAKLLVGPLARGGERFRTMTVAAVMAEMRHDPRFLLRTDFGATVRMDYIKEVTGAGGCRVVVGQPPAYPVDMAHAAINGEVTARLRFTKGRTDPLVQVLHSSHVEFADAVSWALARWKLHDASAQAAVAPESEEFECRVIFIATE